VPILQTDPAGLTNRSIQEYAERVGKHHEIYDPTGRADIDDFVARLGGSSEYATDNESLHVWEPGNFTIFLPHFTSTRRDRFTKAHELGHYFLHYLYPKETGPKRFGRGGRDRAETEANVFASALLMPEDAFRAAFRELTGDTWKLAARFDVSPQAASVRAEALQLLQLP
jgi:Zn-dependent peptidase ImmA (M78 family)